MSNLSFSSFNSLIEQSDYGCGWSVTHEFYSLTEEKKADITLLALSQVLSPYALSALIQDMSESTDFEYVRRKPLASVTSTMAFELGFTAKNIGHDSLRLLLQSLAKKYHIDLLIKPTAPSLSEPGLLIMDMDSTMIQIECIDEIARLAGKYDEVAAVTAQAMNGKLGFADSLNTRVACLKGIQIDALNQIKAQLPLMPGLWNVVQTLKANHWRIAIASGGFTFFANHLKNGLGLDFAISNTLDIQDGVLTGKTLNQVVDAQLKAQTLCELQQKWQISPSQTVAIGDGANDLKMLAKASLGIAFHAKPSVIAQAQCAISYQPLDALLLLLEA